MNRLRDRRAAIGGLEFAAGQRHNATALECLAMTKVLFTDSKALEAICRRHGIVRLSLFGSRLRGEERPDSDVDLLVAFAPGREPGLIALAGIEAELSELVGGVKVDLRTPDDLSRYFRDEVVRAAEVQYAA